MAGLCGAICPSSLCQTKCSHSRIDYPINIPGIQAEIIHQAHLRGKFLSLIPQPKLNGKSVAIIGGGPSGLSCAASLASRGYKIVIYEKSSSLIGDIKYIPSFRLPPVLIQNDIDAVLKTGEIEVKLNTEFKDNKAFDAICYCIGKAFDYPIEAPGTEFSINARNFLLLKDEDLKDKSVAVVGCGAVAVDCAVKASKSGCSEIRILYRRTLVEAPLHDIERGMLDKFGVSIIPRTIVEKIEKVNGKLKITCLNCDKQIKPIPGANNVYSNFDFCVSAIGQFNKETPKESGKIFLAGQAKGKNCLAVQAVASGKNAAIRIHNYLMKQPPPDQPDDYQSSVNAFELNFPQISIKLPFNEKVISSPFIVGAGPYTNSIENCRKILQLGWGGVSISVGKNHSDFQASIPETKNILNTLKQEFPDRLFGLIGSADDELKNLADYFGNNPKVMVSKVTTIKDIFEIFNQSVKFIQLDPSNLKRGINEIKILNASLYVGLKNRNSENLANYHYEEPEPEDEDIEDSMINKLTNPHFCLGCGRCLICPKNAIELDAAKWIYNVDSAKCIGCGICVGRCPTGAISLVPRSTSSSSAH